MDGRETNRSEEFSNKKPLPPITPTGEREIRNSDSQTTDRPLQDDDDDARSTASNSAFDRPGEGKVRPRIVRGFRPEAMSDEETDDDLLNRSVTFATKPMMVVKRKAYDGREVTLVSLETQTDWDWVESVEQSGTAITIDTDATNERERSNLTPISSKADAQEEKQAEPQPYQMPYSDEYGIPILDLSSDTDDSSDEEVTHKKMKDDRTFLPSVGPPNILQYQKESEKHDILVEDPEERIDLDVDEDGVTHGMYSGKCEFCQEDIKPFPSVEQQKKFSPEELYCCNEYREFVEFIHKTNKDMEEEQRAKNKMIDIKPHEHVGSKQERNAAKEKAVQRMRERELLRKQQEASGMTQNFFALGAGGISKAFINRPPGGGLGNVTMKDMFVGGGSVGGANSLGTPKRNMNNNMSLLDGSGACAAVASQMTKEIMSNIPEEALMMVYLDPFEIEYECAPGCPGNVLPQLPCLSNLQPGELGEEGGGSETGDLDIFQRHSKVCDVYRAAQYAAKFIEIWRNLVEVARQMKTINYQLSSQKCLEEGWTLRAPSPLMDDDGNDVFVPEPLNAAMLEDGKLRHRPLIEKYYDSGKKFLTMFPDGTGNVFYPSGNLAILVSSVKLGQYLYTIHQDLKRAGVVAAFEPNGYGYCYYPNGDIRLYIDQYGGMELDSLGGKRRKWSWKDQVTHVHAPPFQPICIGINKHLGLRVMSQDNISLTFSCSKRGCRFNMGSKLKLVAPENAPLKEVEEEYIFLEEKKNYVESLLDKVANLLKFPNHPKLDKMLPPLHITMNKTKTEKMKKDRKSFLAQQAAKEKRQNPLAVN